MTTILLKNKTLQDIWIIKKTGIVLFYNVFNEIIPPTIFGGLISALMIFAENISNGGLSKFELNDKSFTIIKEQGLLFIATASKKHKQQKINKALKDLSTKFLKKYSDRLTDFCGNTGIFSEFVV